MDHLSQFQQRVILSGVLIPLLFLVVYLSVFPYFAPLFVFLAVLTICCALWEFYHIAKRKGLSPASTIGIIATCVLVTSMYFSINWLPLIFITTLACTFLYYFFRRDAVFLSLAVTLFGLLYLALPLSYLIPINFDFGRVWFLYLLLTTKMTDIGAYFFGKGYGKHKLAPVISPAKTWEGALGGVICSVLTSCLLISLFAKFYPNEGWISLWEAVILGFGVSVLAQFGDIVESLIKRDIGVKDSNRIPGLGGVLDIVDSLVFTTPLVYYFLEFSKVGKI